MSEQTTPCSSADSGQFDFWVGDWDLEWPAEQMGGRSGDVGRGSNRVVKALGGCVVEENFSTSDGAFQGRSHSVYDSVAGFWRQTWVDNQGGYLLFAGGLDGETMELRTPVVERDGDHVVNRMVFGEVTEDSLKWDWQGSRDGGESWTNLWNISYKRRS